MRPDTHTLRCQMGDWNELSLDMQEAAYWVWCSHGLDACRNFCIGA